MDIEIGQVFAPSDPRRRSWEGEVVQIRGPARLGHNRTARLRCSDGTERKILLRSLMQTGSRGFVRLPSKPSEASPTSADAPAPERHRFTTQQQIVGGDRSCRIWRCAGCQATQTGLGRWQQVIFPPAPSERFVTHLRDQEHTIVCSRACAATVARRWAVRLAPKAMAAAQQEGALELLSRRLDTLTADQWATIVRLSMGLVVAERRQLNALGERVLELVSAPARRKR